MPAKLPILGRGGKPLLAPTAAVPTLVDLEARPFLASVGAVFPLMGGRALRPEFVSGLSKLGSLYSNLARFDWM